MKSFSMVALCLALNVVLTHAQPANNLSASASQSGQATAVPPPTPYRVVDRGANYRTWQRETYEQAPNGQIITHTHKYYELSTGVCYKNLNGKWTESKENIEIMPDGTAAATNGQHQAYFPGNIYTGAIELVTVDGQQLWSRPSVLCYIDGTNSVVLATLKSSVGELVGSNQVVYPDAFDGLAANLSYLYTKAGFEQNVVLLQQPAAPESFGLNPATTRLEVLTEFTTTTEPVVTATPVASPSGLQDHILKFGAMKMLPGKAFKTPAISSPVDGTPVYKDWMHVQGRTFLVEMLPYTTIKAQLKNLPLTASTGGNRTNSWLCKASTTLLLPAARSFQASSGRIRLAKASLDQKPGLVMDYVILGSEMTNLTFQSDTTYFMPSDGYLWVDGTVTIEGGTVIKFAASIPDSGFTVDYFGNVNCETAPYRPAIFTAQDDDTVGEAISGSTGSPSGYYGVAIEFFSNYSVLLHDVRLSYLQYGLDLYTAAAELDNIQAIDCNYPILWGWAGLTINNGLFYNIGGAAIGNNGGTPSITGTQLTVHNCNIFTGGANLTLVNSLMVNVTNLLSGGGTLTTNCVAILTTNTGVFQTVGGGGHYLANGSPYRDCGATNIDAGLLLELAAKTTYPPFVFSATNIPVGTNVLGPQAPRDVTAEPDLGYHYDPLDYVFGGCDLSNNLTFLAGTAVGWYEDYGRSDFSGQPYGIALDDGATLTFNGTVTQPCEVAVSRLAQEGGNGNWNSSGWMAGVVLNGSGATPVPQLSARFTQWSGLNPYGFLRDNWAYGSLGISHSEFYTVGIGSYLPSYYFTNCLFWRSPSTFWSQIDASSATYQNCTFYNGGLALCRYTNQSPSFWAVIDNTFDGTAFLTADDLGGDTNYTTFDYNAYNSSNTNWMGFDFHVPAPPVGTLETVGPHDLMVTNGYNWQSSWLGDFYLPPYSPLINAGSTTADKVGLYQFTTQTNQTKEGFSYVDIGYHYVAVNPTKGLPDCTYTNGIPDYIVDSDGNGLPDWWEILYFGHIGMDPNADPDGDGYSNYQEYLNGTNPTIADQPLNILVTMPGAGTIVP